MNVFAVVSYGDGWGCVSEYAENIMSDCLDDTMPANMTAVSDDDSCR